MLVVLSNDLKAAPPLHKTATRLGNTALGGNFVTWMGGVSPIFRVIMMSA